MGHIKGLTEGEEGLQIFPKPAPGSWTEAFGLDTGPMSLRDIYDPEFYELEREAVFRRSWLFIGRVEQLPRNGSYFVKELPFLDVSVLVARGMDGEVRAFHNVCSHRGNKLVWSDRPAEESHGLSRQLACKYHGWRFDLDGQVSYVHNAPEFFDLESADLTLTTIHCEVWSGFVFINLDKSPRQSLREYLTPPVAALEDFPYEKMTELYQLDAVVNSNWKVYIDAYQELYHVPYVHSKMNNPNVVATGTDKVPFMVPAFFRSGKHHMYSSGGPNANFKVRASRPLDLVFNSSFYGAIDAPDVGPLGEGINPLRIDNWGLDNWQIYPNFSLQQWGLHWYMTYEHWPIDANSHRFILSIYFVPPKNASERLAQEHAALSIREFQFQDVGSSEALQRSIRSGAREVYYLNDQEVLVRHLHQQVIDDVEEYKAELAAGHVAKHPANNVEGPK